MDARLPSPILRVKAKRVIGFTIGNTNSPFYNGKYFAAAEDIIVVTANYRLNIFGFPGAPDLAQNLGLRDQRTAVEWVRDNIASFGGDPERITIAGQSSGGVAVDYWSYAYRSEPIVNGLIAHSGNAFSFPVNAPGVSGRNWNTAVDFVGCSAADDTMACMRQADWEKIKAAAASIRPSVSSSVLRSIPPFYPQPDGELVFSDYLSRAKSGQFAKIVSLASYPGNGRYNDCCSLCSSATRTMRMATTVFLLMAMAALFPPWNRSSRSFSNPSHAPTLSPPARATTQEYLCGFTGTSLIGKIHVYTLRPARTTEQICI